MNTLNFVNFKNMVEAINSDVDTEEADYQALLSETDVRGRGYIEAAIQFIQGTTEYRRGLAKAKEALATIRHLNGRVGGNKTAGGTFHEAASIVARAVSAAAQKGASRPAVAAAATTARKGRPEALCDKAERIIAFLGKGGEWNSQKVIQSAVHGHHSTVHAALNFLCEKGLIVRTLKNRNPAHKTMQRRYNRTSPYYSIVDSPALPEKKFVVAKSETTSVTAGVRMSENTRTKDRSSTVLEALKTVKLPTLRELMKVSGHDFYTIKRALNVMLESGQIVQVKALGKNNAPYASWRIAGGHA
jgi:hypothetical protein